MPEIKTNNINEIGGIVANNISAMLAYWDKDQVCQFANNAFTEWFGKSPGEMIGKITMKEFLGPVYEKTLPYIENVLHGEKQVFEREITISTGGSRHSLICYFPNILDGQVNGFFVHISDVSPIMALKEEQLTLEKTKDREVLHSVIETRELERKQIAETLRASVCQTLAYCKIILQSAVTGEMEKATLKNISDTLQKAISELNELSNNLSPFSIDHLGLKPVLEDMINVFQEKHKHKVVFNCGEEDIEELLIINKVSVFRIIQNYLAIMSEYTGSGTISISLKYNSPFISLQFGYDDLQFKIPHQTTAFNNISNWVECYGGSLEELKDGRKNILKIGLDANEYKYSQSIFFQS